MKYIIVLLLLCVNLSVIAATRTVTTRTPYYNYYLPNQNAYYGGDYIPQKYRYRNARHTSSMFSDLNDLEKYAMNKNFLRDSELTRIERLEMQAFGAVQQGDIGTRYENVRNAILTRPKQNYKTSLLRNIADYFSGQATGLTPMVQDEFSTGQYNSNPFGKSTSTSYNSPWGSGHRTDNYGIGSGMGVHILD